MSRWFNTAVPCKANKHYMLPPTIRLPDLGTIIEQESYFVVHAPRQTGKTTAMLALAKQLTESAALSMVGEPWNGNMQLVATEWIYVCATEALPWESN